jgi:hypothetical protein
MIANGPQPVPNAGKELVADYFFHLERMYFHHVVLGLLGCHITRSLTDARLYPFLEMPSFLFFFYILTVSGWKHKYHCLSGPRDISWTTTAIKTPHS